MLHKDAYMQPGVYTRTAGQPLRLHYGHNLELYNSKASVAGCIFYNNLPNNMKQVTNNNQFARELKKLLIKGCYYSIQEYLN
jgi:hypothetical protein